MSVVEHWLDARQPAPPPSLRAAIDAALRASAPGAPDAPVHDRLAEAGLEALGRVARKPSERSTAAELLAADALLTYACEAAAEAGPDAVDALTGRLDAERFAGLLEEGA